MGAALLVRASLSITELFMTDLATTLAGLDRLCGQIAVALHNAQAHIYATLAIMLVLSLLLFPPKNDPDRL
jgi:hypothetical protein